MDRDAADEHEHAKDEIFVDMLPGDNSRSHAEEYSEDLQLFASPSPQRRRTKAESHSWHLHSRVLGCSAVSAELSKLEAQHCHGGKFGSGGSRTTLDHVIYRYRCAMHNYIACPWLCHVKIQRSLGDSFTGVVVDSQASIHAQHQCEIEIVSGVHHIEHNVEQKLCYGGSVRVSCSSATGSQGNSGLQLLSENSRGKWRKCSSVTGSLRGQAQVRPIDKLDEACTNADDRMMLVQHCSGYRVMS